MIFNNNKIYATVWSVKNEAKFIDARITTSEKNQDDEYVFSSWWVRFIGHAKNALNGLKERDKIIITKSKFTNERIKGEDGEFRSFFKFLAMEAEFFEAEKESEINKDSIKEKSPAKDTSKEKTQSVNDLW